MTSQINLVNPSAPSLFSSLPTSFEIKDAALSNEFGAYIKRIQTAADNMRAANFAHEEKSAFLDTIDAARKWTEEGYKSGTIGAFGFSQFNDALDREYNQGALAFKNYRRNVEKCEQERAAIEREKIDPAKMDEQIELWAKEPQTRRSLLIDLVKHFNKVFRKRSDTVMAFKWGYIDLMAALKGIDTPTIQNAEDNLTEARMIVKDYNERGEYKELARSARFCARQLAALCANILHYNPENTAPAAVVESAPVVDPAPAPLLISRDPAPLLLTVEKAPAPVVSDTPAPAARPSAVEIASWEGEDTPAPAASGYILPNIETARRSHECNHMGEFSAARYTAEYMREIDAIRAAAARQIEKVDPVFRDQIRGAVAYYEKKRAQLENDYNRTGASYATWFIAGPSKYNVRKSDAKNRRMDDIIKEIGALYDKTLSKIRSAGKVISSDNSDALRLLRDKLEKLQARQKLEIEANKYWRKNNYSWDGYKGPLEEETKHRKIGNGYDSKFFTENNAQEIRRIKERIADIEKRAATNYGAPVEFDGGRVEFNVNENRLQLIFDDKPDADTRETLKKSGFRWSPRSKAWQRQLNHNAIWVTKQLGYLPKEYKETVEPEAVEPEAVEPEAVEPEAVEPETVEPETAEEIDDDDETSDDDDAEETTEEKERALELVAGSTADRLGAGVVPWRHLSSDMETAPRSWDRLRPYSLNNTLIIESTPETRRARLLITFDRADVKDDDGKSVIDWTQYDDAGADVWQPKKFRVIPIKDDAGNIIKDDDGKILVTRKVSKYGKVTIHDADLFPWLEKKRAAKYAQLERIVASEIKERDAKRADLLGAAPEKWADNLAQIVKRFFDGTKLTTDRAALGQEIARAFIASRLGFDLEWNADAEKKDAARLLALCTQGDKKHKTTGHALQVVLKHVNKCVASILYQSQPTAIKPREEKQPAPVVEEKQPVAPVKNDDEEAITDALETFEREATQARYTGGLVHQDNARRAENDALLAIEEARKNKSVPDDALEIYSDRVERIHVDTALALKEEAKRRYGAEWIDRHVTFC